MDDSPRTVDNLRRLLGFEGDLEVVGSAVSARAGIEEARRQSPDVIVMDVNLPDMDGIRATEVMSSELPLIPVVLMSVQEDREYLRRAMHAGARQFLVKPFSGDELVGAIRKVHSLEVLKRQPPQPPSEPRPGPAPPPPAQEAAPPRPPVLPAPELTAPLIQDLVEEPPVLQAPAAVSPPSAPALETRQSQPALPAVPPPIESRGSSGIVTVVFSGKGGVGKSVIAVNLAAALIQETGASVALVDLDLQFGDIAVMLGLDPSGTLADVSKAFPKVDAPLLGTLMPEAPGGIRALAAPLSPELAELVTAEHVRLTLQLLRGAFDHVVVDCSPRLDDVALEAIESADKVLIVTDLNVPAIKDAKLVFKLFEHLNVSRDCVHLVLNRFDAHAGVTVAQLEANLRCPVSVRIPSHGRAVLESIQKGVPLTILQPESEISLRMRELVGRLVPLPDAKGRKSRKSAHRRFWTRPNAS